MRALVLVLATGAWMLASPALAEDPTPDQTGAYLQSVAEPCHTPEVPEHAKGACIAGMRWWPARSGHQLRYIPVRVPAPADWDTPDIGGYASMWEDGRCEITISPDYADNVSVWAHEFGHCLGLHHDDDGHVHRPDYWGVMDYASTYDHPSQDHDHTWYMEVHAEWTP